jgi:flavin-dependent dehydrogenase
MPEKQRKVVVGAGLAGMVAAINLAKAGYEVTVLEAEARIGGSKQLHPSLHITPINKKKVWEYIGIDLDDCFVAPKKFRMYLGDLGLDIFPDDMSTVERGPRPSSVDTRLHELAVEAGVSFEFGHRVDRLEDLPPDTIIATGLDPRMFENLGLPYRDIPSRHVFKSSELDCYGLGIYSEYASEYFYAAALNQLFYGMLPLEDPSNLNHLASLVRDLKAWEEIDIPEPEWRPVVFRVPLGGPANLRLFHQDKILAGTIAGMMDPFFLFGIHGALVSGRIAALTVMDKGKGQAEFARVNRYFTQTFRAKQVYELLPVKAKLALFKAMARAPYLFSPVIPLISRGIPGHDETDYFYRSFVGPDYQSPLLVRLAGSFASTLKGLVGKGAGAERSSQD